MSKNLELAQLASALTVSGTDVQLSNLISTPIGTGGAANGNFLDLSASGVTNLDAGTVAAPGLIMESETGTGLYRIGANNHGYAVSGAKVLDISSSGLGVAGSVAADKSGKATLVLRDTTSYAAGVGASIDLGGNYRAGGDYQAFTRIAAEKANATDADYGYDLGFYVTANGGATFGVKPMTISSTGLAVTGSVTTTGNVGIGASGYTPLIGSGRVLDVYNVTHATVSVRAVDTGNDRNAALELLSSGNGGSESRIYYGDTDAAPTTLSPLCFYGYHSGTATKRMTLDASGNLLVGGVTVGSAKAANIAIDSAGATTTVNNSTHNITIAGAKLFTVYRADGSAALCFTTFLTNVITIISGDAGIVASASPGAVELGISKSANSHTITFKTGSNAEAVYGSWYVAFIGGTGGLS